MAAKFDTDGNGKGEIWIGAAGWASTNVEKIRAKSYGYSETMNLKEMDETLALAEVDNAVAQEHRHRLLLLHAAPHVRSARPRHPERAGSTTKPSGK